MAKFISSPSVTSAVSASQIVYVPFSSLLVNTIKNGTYDEIVQLLIKEGGKRNLQQSSELRDVEGYNTLVNDALTAAMIHKKFNFITEFIANFAIDFEHPNSRGNKLSVFVPYLPPEVIKQCFLSEVKASCIQGSKGGNTRKD